AKGATLGCVGAERAASFRRKAAKLSEAKRLARSLSVTPSEAEKAGITVNRDGRRRTAFDLLSLPSVGAAEVIRVFPALSGIEPTIVAQLEIEASYAVYLDRQEADIRRRKAEEDAALPEDIDYARVPGLSAELSEKLAQVSPRTLGQAGRIEGMTPAALALLASRIRRASAA
ncbi:MAG: tRNA uridine-5-carboxymethylaminomethyl(34) synthesis enzyme MnmG, partial [Hansschlegelia sp.]